MLIELPPAAREVARPLFAGFPGLHGLVHAALEGAMGTVRADDAARPRIAHIDLDFDLLAGDPNAPAAEAAVRGLSPPFSLLTSSSEWEPLLRRVWGDALTTRTRVLFQPGDWDLHRLVGFQQALPAGFSLKRITIEDAGRFSELAGSLVYNFPSLQEFAAKGPGSASSTKAATSPAAPHSRWAAAAWSSRSRLTRTSAVVAWPVPARQR